MEQTVPAEGKNLPCPKIVRGQEELTPEQEAFARQFAQERVVTMFSTAPIDEAEAEDHLRAAYRVGGWEQVPVRWFKSPEELLRTAHGVGGWELAVHIRWFDSLGAFVFAPFFSKKANEKNIQWDGVGNGVVQSVRKSVEASVWTSVWNSVGDWVWENMWTRWDVVREDVWEVLGVVVEDSVRAYYDESRLSLVRFLHELFEENELIHLARFNEMVCGYHLMRKEAWVVHKPIRLERDAQGRLHSADGMAIQFRDGWGLYVWHGVPVGEQLILHPEQITRKDWLSWRNLEIRRILQERLGNERFIELVGGRCINQGQRAEFIEVDLGEDPEQVARFVRVKDSSTERVYYVRVPPRFGDADAALAWTFDLEKQDYQPSQET